MRDLVDATFGFLFFGTPFQGLPVDDMLAMIRASGEHSREDLVGGIKPSSPHLESLKGRFVNWVENRKIKSFIETHKTQRLVQVPSILLTAHISLTDEGCQRLLDP